MMFRQQLVSHTHSSDDTLLSQPETRNKSKKAIKGKAMYDLRKKLLECEEKRVEAINKLTAAIEEHNNIQRERNDILRQLISSHISSLSE